MNKLLLGAIAGTILGLLDGCSAFFLPEAADMMTTILISSTAKGLINGLIAGAIAKKVSSLWKVGLYSMIAGLILSTLAAIPTGAYLEIIAPGIFVGFLAGIITGKWGK